MPVLVTHVHAKAKAFADALANLPHEMYVAVPSGHYGRDFNNLRDLILAIVPTIDARLLGERVPVSTLANGREVCDATFVEIETYVRQIMGQLALLMPPQIPPLVNPRTAIAETAKRPRTYSVKKVREKYPRAFAPWTPDEDDRLRERFRQGATNEQLVVEFGRTPRGIRLRLEKLASEP